MKALILAALIAASSQAIAEYPQIKFPDRPTIDEEYARLDRDQIIEEEREFQRQQLDYQRKMLNSLNCYDSGSWVGNPAFNNGCY